MWWESCSKRRRNDGVRPQARCSAGRRSCEHVSGTIDMRVNRCPTRISKVQQRIERRLLRQARMLARHMTIRPMAKQLGCSKSTAGRGAVVILTEWSTARLAGLEHDVAEHQWRLRSLPV